MNNDAKKYEIAVGLDGSESSWKALDEAISIARQKKCLLHIVSIQELAEASYSASEVLATDKTSQENLEKIQIKARIHAENAGIEIDTSIVAGTSSIALVDYVKQNHIDLLIVGDIGHSSIWGTLLGTSAEKIVRYAPCSVLIVR
ncbi:universal stress protein [bacterium]|jgi:nucleotide-binding universal stress UspA family protein|nr:universal stress protein [bacterium]QQR59279.1 MAG: universal stress protein [Candidatus Melainabacteria bacterium]